MDKLAHIPSSILILSTHNFYSTLSQRTLRFTRPERKKIFCSNPTLYHRKYIRKKGREREERCGGLRSERDETQGGGEEARINRKRFGEMERCVTWRFGRLIAAFARTIRVYRKPNQGNTPLTRCLTIQRLSALFTIFLTGTYFTARALARIFANVGNRGVVPWQAAFRHN